MSPPPLYLIPGMSPEFPIYSGIVDLLPGSTVIDFLEPLPGESLKAYAARMAGRFPSGCFIAGVSFGGILALEISRLVQPAGCVVISSICDPAELPPWLRVWRLAGGSGCAGMLSLIGETASLVPERVRTSSTMRLTKLAGKRGSWHRWATSAVLDWEPDPEPATFPILRIHGSADTTFPLRYTRPGVVVEGGTHDLPFHRPEETARAIAEFMESTG